MNLRNLPLMQRTGRKMITRLTVLTRLLCLTVAVVLSVQPAASDLPVIRMAYEEFNPYSFTDSDGNARGFSIDLMRRLADAAGYRLQFIPSPNPAESLRMIGSGEADVSSLLALTEERLALGLPTDVLGAFELLAFVRRADGAQTVEGLSGKKIGVVAGSFTVTGAQQIPFARIIEFDQGDTMIVALLAGEVDAVVSPGDSFRKRLRQADVEQYTRALKPALISSPSGFFTAPDRPGLQKALNDAIAAEITPRELAVLNALWFGRPKTLTDYPLFWWAIAFAGSVTLALGILAASRQRHKTDSLRLRAQNEASELLVAALDEVGAAIVIYNEDLRAVHWSSGFTRIFPETKDLLEAGTDMRTIVSVTTGLMQQTGEDRENALEFADKIVASISAGQLDARTVHTGTHRVFEASEFPIGRHYYASLRVDVTRLQKQQDMIRDQAEQLKDSNDRLRTFAAIAAHDLNAPLIQLRMLMQFITDDLEENSQKIPEVIQGHWDLMGTLSHRMSRLINDLLRYADDTASDLPVERADLNELRASVLELVYRKPGINIRFDDTEYEIFANVTALQAVLHNLISNSGKYHDQETGMITVEFIPRGSGIEVVVTDDGPGIPESAREAVFEPFKRLSASVEGTGLGLAFAKRTVERWGGTIRISGAEPRGCRVSFTIPQPETKPQMLRFVG